MAQEFSSKDKFGQFLQEHQISEYLKKVYIGVCKRVCKTGFISNTLEKL